MDVSEATGADRRATVTVDRRGVIQQWGDAATETLGYTADDALGHSLDIVIPPALRPLHWWGFDRAMERGRMGQETLGVPALRKDGRLVVARAIVQLLPGPHGRTDGATVTFVGVGPSWQSGAWRAVLVPVDAARRFWRRLRYRRTAQQN